MTTAREQALGGQPVAHGKSAVSHPLTWSIVALGCFVALFAVMWAPVAVGFEGWLFLFPLFLLLWLPIEAVAIVAVVLSVRQLSTLDDPAVRRAAGKALGIGLALTFASLPVLWFGGWAIPGLAS